MRKLLDIPKKFRSIRVYFVSSYLPRRCGIATFTYDLAHAVGNENGYTNYRIAALNNRPEGYDYPDEVVFEIQQNRINDYRLAADYVNYSEVDLVCLQHEFGIFGGPEGSYIHHFLGNLKKPVVTTFHTILREPPEAYLRSLQQVAELSHSIIVMSHKAVEILETVYGVPAEKISFVHHGVPDVPFVDPNYYKDQFQVEGRFVLLTFGLLNPNKGIETVIKALPEVVRRFPNVAYIILGATHPEIKKLHGEEYRISLQRRVIRLGLEDHVFFHNRFVELNELCEFIGASDIYITPYLSREQITSGTLAYALGMGKAVISTPYTYAFEMLQEGRGRIMEFGDFRGLANIIVHLIENEVNRHQMRKKAYALGRTMVWSRVAKEYLKVFGLTLEKCRFRSGADGFAPRGATPEPLPEINLNQICHLTDDTGIIRHSVYGIPDRRFGYSTGDAALALIVTLMAYNQLKDESHLRLATTYLAFLRHAQQDTGAFYDWMNYARQFTEEAYSEETWGKAIWSLGAAVCLAPREAFRNLAREIFERAIAEPRLVLPLPKAYAILGLAFFLKKYSGATAVRRLLQTLADELVETYEPGEKRWPPDGASFRRAKIAQALLVAYRVLGNDSYRDIAVAALEALTEATLAGEYFNFTGKEEMAGDQPNPPNPPNTIDERIETPMDAGFMVEACLLAYETTGRTVYQGLARTAFDWYLGRNRLNVQLYDYSTGACYDGLGSQGLNHNQGAEAALSFLLANLAVSEQQISRPLLGSGSLINLSRSLAVSDANSKTEGSLPSEA